MLVNLTALGYIRSGYGFHGHIDHFHNGIWGGGSWWDLTHRKGIAVLGILCVTTLISFIYVIVGFISHVSVGFSLELLFYAPNGRFSVLSFFDQKIKE